MEYDKKIAKNVTKAGRKFLKDVLNWFKEKELGSQDDTTKGTLEYRNYSNEERIKMSKFLRNRGWQDLWHWNNWVKTEWFDSHTINIDYAGLSLKTAYLNELNKPE